MSGAAVDPARTLGERLVASEKAAQRAQVRRGTSQAEVTDPLVQMLVSVDGEGTATATHAGGVLWTADMLPGVDVVVAVPQATTWTASPGVTVTAVPYL